MAQNMNSKTLAALRASKDKAQAAINDRIEEATATPVQPAATARLLDALPGLVGAIDTAIQENVGEKVAFILVCFTAGAACHATNINPPADAVVALKALATSWDTTAGVDDVAG